MKIIISRSLSKFIYTALIISTITGCITGPEEEYTIEDYFPVKKGNWWVYEVFTDSSVTYKRVEFDSVFTWENSTVCKSSNQRYYVLKSQELRKYFEEPSDTSEYKVLLKGPIERMRSWYTYYNSSEDSNSVTVMWWNPKWSVEVGGMKYSDYIETMETIAVSESLSVYKFAYFVHGIGLVKRIVKIDASLVDTLTHESPDTLELILDYYMR